MRTPQKNIFEKNKHGYQKTQNFMLISDLLEKLQKNAFEKSYEQNRLRKVNFSAFTNSGFSFLCLTFFWWIFSGFFQRFCTQHKILRFLIPLKIFFKIIFFGVLLVLFGNFRAKFDSNGSIYWKMLFYFKVLEFHFPPVPTLGNSIFSKKGKIAAP